MIFIQFLEYGIKEVLRYENSCTKSKRASVTNKFIHNQIEKGYCLLVGVGKNSTESDIEVLAKKIVNARLFEDDNGN